MPTAYHTARRARLAASAPVHKTPTWAVLACRDENGNGELDRKLIGIPGENDGFSREARGRCGPSGVDDAAIEVGEDATVAPVRLR